MILLRKSYSRLENKKARTGREDIASLPAIESAGTI
jgi:hypothetical protein